MADGALSGPVRTLDPSLYGQAEIFARERRGVFAKSWRLIGHENMLPEPGDFLTDDLAGWPVLAVRGSDGAVRAFHNVCPHRAGPLAEDPQGRCEGAITCRYHGWQFTFEGRLKSARDFGAAEGFDPREHGLSPVRLETWRGFLFVTLSKEAPAIREMMRPVDASWAEAPVQPFALRRSHTLRCDWKVYVENYLEGYHIGAVHPVLAEELGGAEYRVSVEGELVVQEAAGVNDGPQAGVWGWLWPNLGVNVYRDGAMIERITPLGAGRTRLDYLFLAKGGEAALGDALTASDRLTTEDARICEAVQANLSAGAYDRGVLSPRHEAGVAWFQARIAEVHA